MSATTQTAQHAERLVARGESKLYGDMGSYCNCKCSAATRRMLSTLFVDHQLYAPTDRVHVVVEPGARCVEIVYACDPRYWHMDLDNIRLVLVQMRDTEVEADPSVSHWYLTDFHNKTAPRKEYTLPAQIAQLNVDLECMVPRHYE